MNWLASYDNRHKMVFLLSMWWVRWVGWARNSYKCCSTWKTAMHIKVLLCAFNQLFEAVTKITTQPTNPIKSQLFHSSEMLRCIFLSPTDPFSGDTKTLISSTRPWPLFLSAAEGKQRHYQFVSRGINSDGRRVHLGKGRWSFSLKMPNTNRTSAQFWKYQLGPLASTHSQINHWSLLREQLANIGTTQYLFTEMKGHPFCENYWQALNWRGGGDFQPAVQ